MAFHLFYVTFAPVMSDIATELAKLHTLTGAEYSRQVERLALRKEFHLIEDEVDIYSAIDNQHEDYDNLLNASRKAVERGYKVFILPNPKGVRTADVILERRGIYRMYDVKTIQGRSSAANRLTESIGQTKHVLLNLATDYNGGLLGVQVKTYFEANPNALEVLIFKGKQTFSIKRKYALQKDFILKFKKEYGK